MANDPSYLPGRLGFASQADIDEFIDTLARYERGEIDGDAWRAFRLTRGVYGQRQPDVQMLRVKIPQGVLTSAQLVVLARVVERHAGGRCHVTTRQNVQLYGLRMAEAAQAMSELATAGLTTREACGNSVRNVTACPLAGVDPEEIFDVTPYADALARYLLRGPRSSTLPRKFKIAFEGCRRECVHAPINDLAFVARLDAERAPGFMVLVGGGTATLTRSGGVLVPFLPAGEILALAEALLRVFHREGERKNRHKARLKWLIERIGLSELRARVEAELSLLSPEERARCALPFDPLDPPREEPPAPRCGAQEPMACDFPKEDLARFARSNVIAQRQPGRIAVVVTLPLGDLLSEHLLTLAGLCERFGDGTVRTTVDQNLVLRNVQAEHLGALFGHLHRAGLGRAGAGWLSDVVSCPGADSCAIAVTASRGMARALREHLAVRQGLEPGLPGTPLPPGTDGAHIRVSGCPNGCGQHHLATIGLQGGLRKIGGRPLPVYHLLVGGGARPSSDPDGPPAAGFGRLVGKLPARRGEEAVDRLITLWQAQRRDEHESLAEFYARAPLPLVREAISDLLAIDEQSARPEDYVDLGQSAPFSVSEGTAECAM